MYIHVTEPPNNMIYLKNISFEIDYVKYPGNSKISNKVTYQQCKDLNALKLFRYWWTVGWSPGNLPHWPGWAAGEGYYTKHAKSPYPTPPMPDLGWGQRKEGTCAIEVNMAAGGGAGKKPVSLTWGKNGFIGRWTLLKLAKVWDGDCSFLRKHLVHPTPKLI